MSVQCDMKQEGTKISIIQLSWARQGAGFFP